MPKAAYQVRATNEEGGVTLYSSVYACSRAYKLSTTTVVTHATHGIPIKDVRFELIPVIPEPRPAPVKKTPPPVRESRNGKAVILTIRLETELYEGLRMLTLCSGHGSRVDQFVNTLIAQAVAARIEP
jgi:hypothetical protein